MTLNNIDFKSGIVSYDDFDVDPLVPYEKQLTSLDEDMLQVEYPQGYVLDIGWYHDVNGKFVVRVIKDCDWDQPVFIKETRNLARLEKFVQQSIDLIMQLINNKPIALNDTINSNFDRTDFLNCFDEEYISDKESGAFHYSLNLKHGFELRLYILTIDNFASVRLRHKSLQSTIFDLGFEDIISLKLKKYDDDLDCVALELYKAQGLDEAQSHKPYMTIQIKPSVSIALVLPEA